MKAPILFLIFNRIQETNKSFESIKKAKPKRLYIAADGPRDFIAGEKEVCSEVRNIALKIDWDCEVFTLFRDKNLGCKTAIVTAINWFFESEDEGIILEDDVIPTEDFFPFCDIMLEKYRQNLQIKAINGFNQFGQGVVNNSYFFSRGYYPWGWATWKSRWRYYNEKEIDTSLLDDKEIKSVYHNSAIEGIKFNLNIINNKILDTWDYQMLYMIMVQKGYVIVPYANLTSNIGVNGAHSMNNNNIFFKYGKIEIDFLEHPVKIEDNLEMNEKLWQEYKEAYFSVKVKSILFNLNIYLPLRFIYKRIKKYLYLNT